MTEQLRVIDGGLRPARRHVAFGQALIDRHRTGDIADTLRFARFEPAALVARDQPLYDKVAVDWCRGQGVAVARRLGGGATLYAGPGQLGWELVAAHGRLGGGALDELLERAGAMVADALAGLGVEARFQPPGRIECDGRRLGVLGGFRRGGTVYLQGLLLLDLEAGELLRLLTVPAHRLARRSLAGAAARLVTLEDRLEGRRPADDEVQQALAGAAGRLLGLPPVFAPAEAAEEAQADRLHDAEFGTEAYVDRVVLPAGGRSGSAGRSDGGATISAHVTLSAGMAPVVERALFTGTLLISPPDALDTLAARLAGQPAAAALAIADRFFAGTAVESIGLSPDDLCAVLAAAIAQARNRG